MASLLIVDDLISIHEMLEAVIQPTGHKMAFATDGEKGLARYEAEKYDLVLCDIDMRPMDGITLLKQLKQYDPGVVVIIMTAYASTESAIQALKFGAFDYLKKLHKNVTQYTRSGTAQARTVAKGEVGIGISFIFGFDNERLTNKFPVFAAAPCEGTSYEIGGIALIKGSRNREAALRYYDWLMGPQGQQVGARANSLQVPANKTFKPDPRIPPLDNVRLIKYDFEKYGKAAERKRLLERWEKEVNSLPR